MQMQVYDNAAIQIARYADKTHKGTTVHNVQPTPLGQGVAISRSTGEVIPTFFDNRSGTYFNARTKTPIDLNKFHTGPEAEHINKTMDEAIAANVPTHRTVEGKSVKIDNHDQAVAGVKQALFAIGARNADPQMIGVLANDAYQKLDAAKLPINSSNMALAVQTSTIQAGADSPLTLAKTKTSNNARGGVNIADPKAQLQFSQQILDMLPSEQRKVDAELAEQGKESKPVTFQNLARAIETDWKALDKNTALKNKWIVKTPLGENPALYYYRNKDKKESE